MTGAERNMILIEERKAAEEAAAGRDGQPNGGNANPGTEANQYAAYEAKTVMTQLTDPALAEANPYAAYEAKAVTTQLPSENQDLSDPRYTGMTGTEVNWIHINERHAAEDAQTHDGAWVQSHLMTNDGQEAADAAKSYMDFVFKDGVPAEVKEEFDKAKLRGDTDGEIGALALGQEVSPTVMNAFAYRVDHGPTKSNESSLPDTQIVGH
jgi:hypothetical protein